MEIGLADALKALRDELAEAMRESAGHPVRLHVETVNLDLQVAVTQAEEGGGGVKFWVVSADGKASQTISATHTVSLQLKAETTDGGRVLTGLGEADAVLLAD
ncbi:trypco2 family protein [Streptomyces sp. NPDC051677]|uniref:trypco2 family protein n=1 Tax=Streptomyces sp. NPDC051677 TaxID=3365669 RepID=UPI0037CF83B5